MTDAPTVTLGLDVRDTFSSLWVKGVRAVDLEVHCIDSLIGNRYAVDELRPKGRPPRLTLNLNLAPGEQALYLCGVTYPYRWADNAHAAFIPSEGASWHGQAFVPGLLVTVLNAEPALTPTDWGPQNVPATDPRAHDRLFSTCRNWQFAQWLASEGIPVERNPERFARQRQQPKRREPGLFRVLGGTPHPKHRLA